MACAAAVSVAMLAGCGDSEGDSQRPGGVATLDSATSTLVMPYDPVADTTDPRNLVAMATHIFTGQVAALSGTEALSAGSETQYDVTVGVVVKGTVPGTALVNQQGGTVAGVYMSLGGDVPLVPRSVVLVRYPHLGIEGVVYRHPGRRRRACQRTGCARRGFTADHGID